MRASHAKKAVSHRSAFINEPASSCRFAKSNNNAKPIQPAENMRKAGVQKNQIFGASHVKKRSGSKRLLRQKRMRSPNGAARWALAGRANALWLPKGSVD